jgi:hypothetical protein
MHEGEVLNVEYVVKQHDLMNNTLPIIDSFSLDDATRFGKTSSFFFFNLI